MAKQGKTKGAWKKWAAGVLVGLPPALASALFFLTDMAMIWAGVVGIGLALISFALISLIRAPYWPDLERRGPHPDGPRNIILLSDGTGNSSGKLLKTNVWRFYEAIDLGKPSYTTNGPVQLAYYDNGVGTSSVRILAALGGVFGLGLSRNVRDMYKFLCRNYHADDKIHAIGFSRGAFTIRLLVALICEKGIITYEDEGDLDLQARDAWREFRRQMETANPISALFVRSFRWLTRQTIRMKRRAFGQRDYAAALAGNGRTYRAGGVADHAPNIDFVGVWDTVAAYGGPIVELTRAFDQLIWPLTMNNYHLSEKVLCARHALALDDKRDAFTPLPWDEVHEQSLIAEGKVKPGRLQQVWFAGMHADVGGGYADESLSYVSLAWMMDHAKSNKAKAAINLLPLIEDRIRILANAFGPIHDSRGGPGAAYRYQPRYIKAWVSPPPDYTQTYRDPTIGGEKRGLLIEPIRLHSSVVERIKSGTDSYAPINIPREFCVDHGPSKPCGPKETVNDNENYAHVGDLIGKRRTWYFVSFWLVTFLLALPFLPDAIRQFSIKGYLPLGEVADSRSATFPLEALANLFLPSFAQQWSRGYSSAPFTVFILGAIIVASNARGLAHESRMTSTARMIWESHFRGWEPAKGPDGGFRRTLRYSNGLQTALAWWKWWIVPNLLGLVLLASMGWLTWATFAQTRLAVLEDTRPQFQRDDADWEAIGCEKVPDLLASKSAGPHKFRVDISQRCSELGIKVRKGQVYSILLHIPPVDTKSRPCPTGPWCDGPLDANPKGRVNEAPLEKASEVLNAPLRRVMSRPQMVPLFKTYGDRDHEVIHSQWKAYWQCLWNKVGEGPLDARAACQSFKVTGRNLASLNHVKLLETADGWRGRYTPQVDGNLQFFVNETVDPAPANLLWKPWTSYGDNWGHADITITEESKPLP